jgi:hypothetical protein
MWIADQAVIENRVDSFTRKKIQKSSCQVRRITIPFRPRRDQRPVRLSVRTQDFHSCKRGSIPLRDDHAVLEITISAKGEIESAQSTIAIQGRSITSDLIRSGNEAGQKLVGMDRAVQIGTDLVADVSAKLLREKLVEAGRVSYPAALRHNYNLLFQAIRVDPPKPPAPATPPATPGTPASPGTPADPAAPAPAGDTPAPTPENPEPPAPAAPAETPVGPPVPTKPTPKLEINGSGQGNKTELPAKK